MARKKITYLICYGTRPELIKVARLYQELKKNSTNQVYLCNTGQHMELMQSTSKNLNIKPDFSLDLMKPNQHMTDIMQGLAKKFSDVLLKVKPDWVLVQGDTISAGMCALIAFTRRIKLGHIEAGLRSFDLQNPFPEEGIRRMISQIATVHFAPTKQAKQNLLQENIKKNIYVTGNTGIDLMLEQLRTPPSQNISRLLKSLPKTYALITLHRRENFGLPLETFCKAIKKIAADINITFIWPVHPNPNIRSVVHKLLDRQPGIHLTDPFDYQDFYQVLRGARFVLSDSGGLQEECPPLGIPLLILRTTTERPECVSEGAAKLVGTNPMTITKLVKHLNSDSTLYKSMAKRRRIFGDGTASKKISLILERFARKLNET